MANTFKELKNAPRSLSKPFKPIAEISFEIMEPKVFKIIKESINRIMKLIIFFTDSEST